MKLIIQGNRVFIKEEYPKKIVQEATSYMVQGAQFSPSYKRKLWDGRKHFFDKRTESFPAGLLESVTDALKENGFTYEVIDLRKFPEPEGNSFKLNGVSFEGKRDYQQFACEAAVKQKSGILHLATNAGKTEIAAALIQYYRLPTLFIVPNLELLYQTKKRFEDRLDHTLGEIGIIGDSAWEPGTWITIASVQSLHTKISEKKCQDFLKSVDLLFLDECHNSGGSMTGFEVAQKCTAMYRFGLSGTPLDRTDGADMQLLATTGPVIYRVTNKLLIDRGISAKTDIIFTRISEPVLDKKLTYPQAYKQGQVENEYLQQCIVDWTACAREAGLSVLILVEEIMHGEMLNFALLTSQHKIMSQFIHGSEDTDVRREALAQFDSRELPVLIASRILDQGVSVDAIDVLILAGSKKSKIRTLQRIGRGLRGKRLILIDFLNTTNKYLLEHSMKRVEDYKAEKCFKIQSSNPDASLLKRIWNEQ